MHCSAKIQEWFAFHFSAGDDPATLSCLALLKGSSTELKPRGIYLLLQPEPRAMALCSNNEISQPKPEPCYDLNSGEYLLSFRTYNLYLRASSGKRG